MSKKNTLSFSQISKYSQCAKSYEYHYLDRIREVSTTSALQFGTSLDKALNAMLEDIKAGKLGSQSYNAIFEYTWSNVEINKVAYSMPECILVGYSKADFQEPLLTPEDLEHFTKRATELAPDLKWDYLGNLKEDLDHKKSIRNVVPFAENEHKLLSLMNWLVMRRKGFLMIEAYLRDIVPQITEVLEVQHKVELGSDSEDSMIGYIDAIVKVKGHDEPIILDNKSSSMPYEGSDVFYSQQLSIYSYILDLKKAGFAVLLKNIKLNKSKVCSKCKFKPEAGDRNKTCNNVISDKRCHGEWIETLNPRCDTQLMVDEIPETNKHLVIDNVSEINNAIHQKVFPRNFEKCRDMFGRDCIYIKLCYENSMKGLVKLDEDNKS